MILTNKVPCICYRSIASLSQNDFNLVSFVSKGKGKAGTNHLLDLQTIITKFAIDGLVEI